jgi:aminopeptidase N
MAVSAYPKEGNPLWEEWSTIAIAETLKTYSKFTFDYPYHKAVSVHGKSIGMEYPMICFNFGRPNEDGSYSDRTKYGMIGVIIHEVGHNYFPMIVNSDERQWGWMDEGINSFAQFLTEQQMGEDFPELLDDSGIYPSRRGFPYRIVNYMKGSQDFIAPIMSNPEQVYQLGNNAYGKPATALNILRETVMGPEKFDYAFKTFSQRWMFKHPTPEDFFRTMEDASAVDLDWFWRGWFYTTDYVDIAIEDVKTYKLTDKITEDGKEYLARFGITDPDSNPRTQGLIYVVPADAENIDEMAPSDDTLENSQKLKTFLMDNFTEAERQDMGELPNYFYEITFTKPGGLVMPVIIELTYEDGTKEMKKYPVQVWRKNDNEISKTLGSQKKITNIQLDPNLETADIDVSNNVWPKEEQKSEFEQFEESKD